VGILYPKRALYSAHQTIEAEELVDISSYKHCERKKLEKLKLFNGTKLSTEEFQDSLAIRYGLRCAQGAFLNAGMYAANPLQWCMGYAVRWSALWDSGMTTYA